MAIERPARRCTVASKMVCGAPRFHTQVDHLIEVAVVQPPVPTHRQRGAAHQAVDGGRVERVDQLLHVGLQVPGVDQELQVAADRHVGDGVEPVERRCRSRRDSSRFQSRSSAAWAAGRNAPTGLVTRFSSRPEPSTPYPSSLKRRSAAIDSSNTPSPRCASVCRAANERERRHHLDLVLGEELRQIGVVGQLRDGQVAAVHHVAAGGAGARDDLAKAGVQLRRAARDVQRWRCPLARGTPGTRPRPSSGITSVRSGPASTWQWWHAWLQRLPTLICRTSTPGVRSGA